MQSLDDIKLIWQDLNDRLSHLEAENKALMNKVKQSNYITARDKLVKKYYAFIFLEIIMIIFMSFFLIFNPYVNEKYRIGALVYWDLFFIMEIAIDTYLLMQIQSIDIYNSPITEVARRAARNWKFHKLAIVIGLPLAFGAIIIFALALDANEYTIFGMIVGGVVGAIIGGSQLLKIKKYYKRLQVDE